MIRGKRSHELDCVERDARAATLAHVLPLAAWNLYVTITFSADVSEATAQRAFREWAGSLVRQHVRAHVPFVRATDRQECGRWHHHIVLALPPSALTREANIVEWAQLTWAHTHGPTGNSRVVPIDIRQKNEVLRYVVMEHSDVAWNVVCTRTGDCKRRSGCAVAATGWR